ncbi:hypothetical protein J3W29_001517 [Salmonella enterica]|nr:hypothetical protein [Salmonella enterica]EFO6831861.1 hypothetical protein [Salmonella enterica subsp. enterica serovar Agbeni]EEC5325685.1 hypothetical protein [Salmonella enterica]EEH4176585.1 hypothetical protein [Salmonella enterica]EEH9472349.1 hypothetical protein [Salmonella enterica]
MRQVFPAPAGINRSAMTVSASSFRVPRASGDKPTRKFNYITFGQCSPRQRG